MDFRDANSARSVYEIGKQKDQEKQKAKDSENRDIVRSRQEMDREKRDIERDRIADERDKRIMAHEKRSIKMLWLSILISAGSLFFMVFIYFYDKFRAAL